MKNRRWCQHCKKEVSWDNTVKGFKKDRASFFVMTHDAIEKLKPEKMDIIEIKEFISQEQIEILYIDSHYYLMPTKEKNKPFYLFAQALNKSKKVAIGQFVMHEKEHVVAISFYKNILLLNTLHYQHEIRTMEIPTVKAMQPTKEELSLALLLINKLTRKKFVLDKYKDVFVERLKKALISSRNSPKKTVTKIRKKRMKKDRSLATTLKESLGRQARV